MIELTERQIRTLQWLDAQVGGVSPMVEDITPWVKDDLDGLVKLGLVAEMRCRPHIDGCDDLLAYRLLPNPEWNP